MSIRFLTAGESHGKALVGILEGMPSGISVTEEALQIQAQRRKMGHGRGHRMKIETDALEILSGVRFGFTTGAPISVLLPNLDFQAWKDVMQVAPKNENDPATRRQVTIPRPGHADLLGGFKYAHSDLRDALERASARETAMRVALGSIARLFLGELGIEIGSRVLSISSLIDDSPRTLSGNALSQKADESSVRVLSKEIELKMTDAIDQAKKAGDTLGGVFEIVVSGVPRGLGSYVQWDRRLEGRFAEAFLSLNAIKGVEVGLGFQVGFLPGSEVHDELYPAPDGGIRYGTNRSGGIDAGISNGEEIIFKAAMKPIATLMKPLNSVDLVSGEAAKAHIERSDVCAVPAASVIGESLAALVLTEAVLEKFGGDSMEEILPRVNEWRKKARKMGSDLAHRLHGGR